MDSSQLTRIPDTVLSPSSAKPFQAIPLVASGAADRFGFTEQEVALACGSHNGEPIHTQIAARDAKESWR
jgi:L-asparaginase II